MQTTRTLKVRLVGDFWKGAVKPSILLQGKWLEQAGIAPESRVAVENPALGVLVIRTMAEEGAPCASPT